MTTPPELSEAHALLRLRAMREEAARRTVQRCRDKQQRCQRAYDRRVQQIAEVRHARRALVDWLRSSTTQDSAREGSYTSKRLVALDEELELAEVELLAERKDLLDTSRDLEMATAAWLHEHARLQAAEQLASAAGSAPDSVMVSNADSNLDSGPGVLGAPVLPPGETVVRDLGQAR